MMTNNYLQNKICPLNYRNPNGISEKTIILLCQSENVNEDNNHTEEVVIGSEQGTTFPAKIGTTICSALIDTGTTRSCMSEKYYKKLHLAEIHLLQNINVKSATGSNLTPLGLVNCTFELGKTKFRSDFISLLLLLVSVFVDS